MSRGQGILVLSCALLTASVACNGKSTSPVTAKGDSGAPDAGSISQACSDYAAAECGKRSSCTNGAEITRDFGTLDVCLAREALSCTIGLQAPDTGNSPSLVESCAQTLPAVVCSEFFLSNLPAPCVAAGSKTIGAPCAFNGQCSTSYCDNDKNTTCGTCGAPPEVQASCISSNCARGQECSLLGTCVVPGTQDAGCDNNAAPCASDFSCIGNIDGSLGVCEQGLTDAGQGCGGSLGECDTTQGLVCGPASSRICQPLVYAVNGAPCGNIDGGAYGSCLAGSCYTDAGVALAGQLGGCKAAAADGDPCDITFGPPCLSPSRCEVTTPGATSGVCTVPSGATCG